MCLLSLSPCQIEIPMLHGVFIYYTFIHLIKPLISQ